MATPYCTPIRITDWSEPEDWDDAPTRLVLIDEAVAKAFSAPHQSTLEQRFREQAERWQRETAHLSSPLQRMMHPSYQAILGMGAEYKHEVVGFLLHDMQNNHRD